MSSILSGIRNIVFDIGGVIIDIDHRRTAQAFAELGIPDFITRYSMTAQKPVFEQYELGQLSCEEFRRKVAAELPLKLTDEQFDSAWSALLAEPPPRRIELIRSLGERYRVFILSNTNRIHIGAMNRKLMNNLRIPSLDALVERAYFSCELGMRKPNRDIYEHVLGDSQLNPSETLFIDDLLANVQTAQSLGYRVHHHADGRDLTEIFSA